MTRVKEVLPDLLRDLFARMRPELASSLVEGLRFSHVRVIAGVPPEGSSVTALAERIGMTKQGCGQFVDQLTRTGHLRTLPDPGDRRVRLVLRTPLGDRFLDSMYASVRELEERFADEVGRQRYATFRSVLEELTAGPAGADDVP